ncbi:MAG: hypothetical protein WCS27_06130, partial [Victivallaceae bacterium]
MKKKLFFAFLTVCGLFFSPVHAAVSLKISDTAGKKSATLENKFIKAVFASRGGKLKELIFKPEKLALTWSDKKPESGALKDQFDHYLKFRDLDYELKVSKNTPEEASIRLTANGRGGIWNFIKVSKVFTLRKNESRLLCQLEISNQPESMAEFEFAYWSHNFLGIKNTGNTISVPTENGIVKFVPSTRTNDFHRDIVRGWLAVSDKKGNGAVGIFDRRYIDTVYSWYCRNALPLDTLEWRFVPVTLKAGERFSSEFALGLFKNVPNIGGAGFSGAGAIAVPEKIPLAETFSAQLSLEGFRSFAAEVTISLKDPASGKIIRGKPKKIFLETAAPKTFSMTLNSGSPGTKILTAGVRAGGRNLFDMEKIVQVGNLKTPVKLTSKAKKIRSSKNKESWDMNLSEDFVTPHYEWAKPFSSGKLDALFLLPVKGARDVVELAQRMDLNISFPTIYPAAWAGMPWRTATNPERGKNGLETIEKFMKQRKYDLFVIGGDVGYTWEKNRMQWKAFPQAVRDGIMARVKNGAGLVYINPSGLDGEMKNITASLKPLSLFPLALKVAPFFGNAGISAGKYGK